MVVKDSRRTLGVETGPGKAYSREVIHVAEIPAAVAARLALAVVEENVTETALAIVVGTVLAVVGENVTETALAIVVGTVLAAVGENVTETALAIVVGKVLAVMGEIVTETALATVLGTVLAVVPDKALERRVAMVLTMVRWVGTVLGEALEGVAVTVEEAVETEGMGKTVVASGLAAASARRMCCSRKAAAWTTVARIEAVKMASACMLGWIRQRGHRAPPSTR